MAGHYIHFQGSPAVHQQGFPWLQEMIIRLPNQEYWLLQSYPGSPENVYNAPPLLAEISDHLPGYKAGDAPHVINLSLLPHTEEDILFLTDNLGIGPIVILSRGYGNCRISSTGTKNVWWVQYYNSQDTLILNTLEISHVPEVACASQEDIADSAKRLEEILAIYQ